ncbi:STAS domain-containing protein [Kitasatospora sp. NPDC006697]|uniref:STAS domain-containing protein n=1 Tax=Kitasatospora sp. NPDC006697 TaxID=3364020 RepID=UPI0036A0CEFA
MTGTPGGDPRLQIRASRGPDGTTVLGLTGDLDQDSAEELRRALAEALADSAPRLLVDLTGVGFCDSTGLNVLLRARQGADGRIELCGLGEQAARLFEVTGAATVFTIHPTPADALETGG